jgi:hypothetical protein
MIARPRAPGGRRSAARVTPARLLAAVAALALVGTAACSQPRDPIVVGEGMVVLENQTDREWRNVVLTVNDHFRGGAPRLLPGGRLNAPLRDFQTAFGQRFDRGRQSVFKVEVSATDASGAPVRLTWAGNALGR